jgi:hypothetical protein
LRTQEQLARQQREGQGDKECEEDEKTYMAKSRLWVTIDDLPSVRLIGGQVDGVRDDVDLRGLLPASRREVERQMERSA